MSGKKGQKHYPAKTKAEILKRIDDGEVSLRAFCRESGISRYAVQSWRRIQNEKVVKVPRKRVRTRLKLLTTVEEFSQENKRLKMENELLRSFLQAAGRK